MAIYPLPGSMTYSWSCSGCPPVRPPKKFSGSKVANAVRLVLHLVQAIRTRTWWLLPTVVLAGSGELIGWGARTWSHYAPLNHDPYVAQYVLSPFSAWDYSQSSRIVALIVSPTPLIGALFITFGRLCAQLGHEYSRLSPRLCEYCPCPPVELPRLTAAVQTLRFSSHV